MYRNLPASWTLVSLGNSEHFKVLGSGVQEYSGKRTYISTGCVSGDKIVEDDGTYSYDNRPTRANLEPVAGAVLFAKMKDSVKVVKVADSLASRFVFSTGFLQILPSSDIDPEYLKQVFLSGRFNVVKDTFAIGSTQPAIRNSDLAGIRVPLPPLEEQRRIARVLYTIDQAMDKNYRAIARLERIQTGVCEKLFSKGCGENEGRFVQVRHRNRLGRHPVRWTTKPAGKVMNVSRGAHPRPKTDTTLWGGEIPMVKIGDRDRGDGKRIVSTKDRVTKKGSKRSKLVEEGTLIVSNAGTVGVPRMVGMEACIHDHWLILSNYEDEIDRNYLYHFISWNRNFLESLASGSTVLDLNTDDFRRFDISYPDLQEQRKIANILDSLHEGRVTECNELERLRRLKKGLMQDLLSGRVRTKDLPAERVKRTTAYG